MRSSKNKQIGEAKGLLNAPDSHTRETHFMVSDTNKNRRYTVEKEGQTLVRKTD